MEPLNLSNLHDPNNQLFVKELQNASVSLLSNQEIEFYSILLSNFQDGQKIDQINGNNILITIYETLHSFENRINTFVKKRFHLHLPYSDERFSDHVFNILHLIAEKAPFAFDDKYKIAPSFKKLIYVNPSKSLTLFEILALKFGDIENPWNAFDLLFKCGKLLLAQFPLKYANLLIYLCRHDSAFLKGRGQICFDRLSAYLLSIQNDNDHPLNDQNDILLVRSLYACLCKLYDLFESLNDQTESLSISSLNLPISLISYHISIPDLQPSIVSYLLRFPISVDNNQIDTIQNDIQYLLKSLIEISNSTEKAGYVLIILAQNEVFASALANNTFWLAKKLNPSQLTVMLVMTIIQNKALRDNISNSRYLFSFITNVINENENTENMMHALYEINRKLGIDKKMVMKFESEGIIDALLNKAEQNQDSHAIIKSILLIFGEFAQLDYSNEEEIIDFSPICRFLISTLKSQNENANDAAKVIGMYADIPQCSRIFRKHKVLQFLQSMNP